jgi:hypothetical protein
VPARHTAIAGAKRNALKQKWEAGCRIHIKWLKDGPLPGGSGFFILPENKLNPYKKT